MGKEPSHRDSSCLHAACPVLPPALCVSDEDLSSHVSYCGCLVAKSCPCDPTDCSPPDSCVHTVSQARIPECVAMSFSKRSSQPRDQNHVSKLQTNSLPLRHQGSPLFTLSTIYLSLHPSKLWNTRSRVGYSWKSVMFTLNKEVFNN